MLIAKVWVIWRIFCHLSTTATLPSAGSNPKGTQRNKIQQMDMFYFAKFRKLKYVYSTIDAYSKFQWETSLSSKRADFVITHLLEVMTIQLKTDNALTYMSSKIKVFCILQHEAFCRYTTQSNMTSSYRKF